MVCQNQWGFLHPLALGDEVNFRLTYEGPLKAASQSENRRVEKHVIRQVFSHQLIALHRAKGGFFNAAFENLKPEEDVPVVKRGEFYFFSVVREKLNLVCDLDILFLRRDNPGHLVGNGGDLDNRIKVLFDALRMPQDDNEVRGLSMGTDNKGKPVDFLTCLTEDDKLITGFRVTTDRLLEPAKSEAEQNNVQLVINVEIKATKLTDQNMAYFAHF